MEKSAPMPTNQAGWTKRLEFPARANEDMWLEDSKYVGSAKKSCLKAWEDACCDIMVYFASARRRRTTRQQPNASSHLGELGYRRV